jgi:hypothetical protein
MSLANTVTSTVVYDDANRCKVLVTGWFLGGANVSNVIVVKANTLFGANNSQPCILDVLEVEGMTSFNVAPGVTSLNFQFVSNGNSNVDFLIVGGAGGHVHMNGLIPNFANTPSGDINLWIDSLGSGDSFSLMLTFAKNNQGVTSNGTPNYGSGAWSNGFINT